MELVKFNEAYHAIMVAKTIDEVKDIRDKAEALRHYLRQQGASREMQNACAEISVRASRRAGEMLAENINHSGGRPEKNGNIALPFLGNETPKLADIGLTKMQSSRFQSIASIPEEIFETVISETIAHQDELTTAYMIKLARSLQHKKDIEQQRQEIASSGVTPPSGLFDTISVDPPWPYGSEYDAGGRRSASPYPEMSLEEIAAINLPSKNDCVLWLWTTHKFMRYSFKILDIWGFRDVAIVTWVKDRMGTGAWLRSQTEFCIMAVKGKPVIDLTNQITVLYGELREHSRKPDSFYEMVDSLCVGYKLDYFSREQREGWVSFGNDTRRF